MGRFGEAHHGFGGHGLLVTHAEPVVVGVRFAAVGEVGFVLIADVKQVAKHLHFIALLAFTEQCRDWHVEVLTEQVEQCGFEAGDRVNSDAQVEGLQAAAAGIAVGKGLTDLIEHLLIRADRAADDQAACVFQRLANALATGYFTDTGVAGVILENDDVAGKKRPVGAAQIKQHAVVAGHRNDLHVSDDRGFGGVVCVHCFYPFVSFRVRRVSAQFQL